MKKINFLFIVVFTILIGVNGYSQKIFKDEAEANDNKFFQSKKPIPHGEEKLWTYEKATFGSKPDDKIVYKLIPIDVKVKKPKSTSSSSEKGTDVAPMASGKPPTKPVDVVKEAAVIKKEKEAKKNDSIKKAYETKIKDGWTENSPEGEYESLTFSFGGEEHVLYKPVPPKQVPPSQKNDSIKKGWSVSFKGDSTDYKTCNVTDENGKKILLYKEIEIPLVIPWNKILIGITGLIIILLFFYYNRRISRNKRTISELRNQISVVQREVDRKQDEQINNLKIEIISLQNTIKEKEVKIGQVNKEINRVEVNEPKIFQPKPQFLIQTFYCDNITSTNPLGFIINKIDNTYTSGIFKISQTSENEASLYINDDIDAQKRVFGSLGNVIDPICEHYSSIHNVAKIVTKMPGSLIKENGVWRVTRKLQIELK